MSPELGRPRARVEIFEHFQREVSEEWLQGIAEQALAASLGPPAGPTKSTDDAAPVLGVVVADDNTLRDLNNRHRGLDETTDVLAFSFAHRGEYYGDGPPPSGPTEGFDFVTPPGEQAGLGEVIISYPQAVQQARRAGHRVDRELVVLLVHGVLHLLGYDHMEPDEEASMKGMESAILSKVLSDE